jgi:hypothetical protein
MSAMVASSLKLNPDAPLFVPAAIQQVEDFSPQWWDLVKSTAWFRDHWYHEHQQLDDMADSLNAFETADHDDDDDFNGLLPDAIDDDNQDDLFYGNTTSTTLPTARPTVTLTTGTSEFDILSCLRPQLDSIQQELQRPNQACPFSCTRRCRAQGAGFSKGRRRSQGVPGEAEVHREGHQVRRQPEPEGWRCTPLHPPASRLGRKLQEVAPACLLPPCGISSSSF